MPSDRDEHRQRQQRESARRARARRTPEQVKAEQQRRLRYYQKNREAILSRMKSTYNADPEPRKAYARDQYTALRAEFIQAYGARCECCGETEPRFLVLDHVNRDGYQDRQSTGGRNTGVLRRLKREGWPKDGYRLLCANCNTATAWGRTCPHQEVVNA